MPDPVPTNPPTVSVALLVRNGMPGLGRLLDALRAQVGCPPFEVVALDSQSTDGSPDALRAADAVVTSIDPARFRFGSARQQVFGLTRGRAIVTLSQDAIPVGDRWLAAMTDPILNDSADIVQAVERSVPGHEARSNLHAVGSPYFEWASPFVDLSCWGLAIGRPAWERTGFGDVPMSEDKYLADKARGLGLRAVIATDAAVDHEHDYTPASLAKRAFNEGMGARPTGGRYPWWRMVRDLTRPATYKYAVSSVVKYRSVRLREAMMFPIRPVFLWAGYAFGREYWR